MAAIALGSTAAILALSIAVAELKLEELKRTGGVPAAPLPAAPAAPPAAALAPVRRTLVPASAAPSNPGRWSTFRRSLGLNSTRRSPLSSQLTMPQAAALKGKPPNFASPFYRPPGTRGTPPSLNATSATLKPAAAAVTHSGNLQLRVPPPAAPHSGNLQLRVPPPAAPAAAALPPAAAAPAAPAAAALPPAAAAPATAAVPAAAAALPPAAPAAAAAALPPAAPAAAAAASTAIQPLAPRSVSGASSDGEVSPSEIAPLLLPRTPVSGLATEQAELLRRPFKPDPILRPAVIQTSGDPASGTGLTAAPPGEEFANQADDINRKVSRLKEIRRQKAEEDAAKATAAVKTSAADLNQRGIPTKGGRRRRKTRRRRTYREPKGLFAF